MLRLKRLGSLSFLCKSTLINHSCSQSLYESIKIEDRRQSIKKNIQLRYSIGMKDMAQYYSTVDECPGKK